MALLINLFLVAGILYLLWTGELTKRHLLLGGVFVLVVLISLLDDLKNDLRVNYRFIQTQCKIFDKSITVKEPYRLRLYYPTFQAAYSTNTQEMNRVIKLNIIDYGSVSSQYASKVLSQYHIGETYPCWYDPIDPTVVVLEQGWPTALDNWMMVMLSAVIFIVLMLRIS